MKTKGLMVKVTRHVYGKGGRLDDKVEFAFQWEGDDYVEVMRELRAIDEAWNKTVDENKKSSGKQ